MLTLALASFLSKDPKKDPEQAVNLLSELK